MPRTFVGPLSLAGVSWPLLRFGYDYGGGIQGQMVGESQVGMGIIREAYCKVLLWGSDGS